MKRKVLILVVLIAGGFQFCYSQMNSHTRMAVTASRNSQNMNRMFDQMNKSSASATPMVINSLKKYREVCLKRISALEKKVEKNNEILDNQSDLSTNKRTKLITKNKKIDEKLLFLNEKVEECNKQIGSAEVFK